MLTQQTDLAARLKMAGIIAHLPDNLPLQAITAVTDALLASPVQAVQISCKDENSLHLIQDLTQRSQGLLTIGARLEAEGKGNTAVSIPHIIQAGANYLTSTQYDATLHHHCHTRQIPYIPGAISSLTAHVLYQKQITLVQMRTGGPSGPDFVATLHKQMPHMTILVEGDFPGKLVSDYAKAGGTAVIVQSALFTHPQQTMADIITRARTLQSAWHNKVSGA